MSGMQLYSYFGLRISSEIELPELQVVSGAPDVNIRIGSVPDHGVPFGNSHEQFVNARVAGRFHITIAGITVDPAPGADPRALRVLLLGRVMACLLRLRGWLPLHGSAVNINGQAAIFLGASGTGKSTLAAACLAQGHSLITDDVSAVRLLNGVSYVLTGGSRLRLTDNSLKVLAGLPYTSSFQVDKFSVDVESPHGTGSFPVRRVYLLGFGDVIDSVEISSLLSATAYSCHSFIRHPWLEREALATHLRDCAALATVRGIRRLNRPKDLDCIAQVVRFVERDMSAPV